MSTEDIVSKAVAEAKEKAAALTEKAEDGKSSDAKNGGEDKAGQKEVETILQNLPLGKSGPFWRICG